MKTTRWQWLFLVAAMLSAGCDFDGSDDEKQPQDPYPQVFLHEDWPQEKAVPIQTVRRPYRIREADQLEVIYHVKNLVSDQYLLRIRDILSIRSPFHPDLDQQEEVQSDGTINLELIGKVSVFDRTISEIEAEINRRYARFIKRPQFAVTLKESNREIDDLREAITTSPRGQSRLVPVAPDGRIALPLIGSVMAAGRTVDELRRAVTAKYHAKPLELDELEVTVNLQTVAPLRVYVMGEVRAPGTIFNDTNSLSGNTHMSLLQALAAAGGYRPARAELSKVLLLRKKEVPSPQATLVNVRQLLENQVRGAGESRTYAVNSAKFRRDIWLEDGDVIYVPTKEIASRADYIEYVWTRGVYAVVPMFYTVNFNYSANDTVDWLGPDP